MAGDANVSMHELPAHTMNTNHVLIGLAVLAISACERPADKPAKAAAPVAAGPAIKPLPLPKTASYMRDHYARIDDCSFDWGHAGKCVPQGASFVGPIYSNSLRLESQVAARREAVEQGYSGSLDETPSDKSVSKSEVRP